MIDHRVCDAIFKSLCACTNLFSLTRCRVRVCAHQIHPCMCARKRVMSHKMRHGWSLPTIQTWTSSSPCEGERKRPDLSAAASATSHFVEQNGIVRWLQFARTASAQSEYALLAVISALLCRRGHNKATRDAGPPRRRLWLSEWRWDWWLPLQFIVVAVTFWLHGKIITEQQHSVFVCSRRWNARGWNHLAAWSPWQRQEQKARGRERFVHGAAAVVKGVEIEVMHHHHSLSSPASRAHHHHHPIINKNWLF